MVNWPEIAWLYFYWPWHSKSIRLTVVIGKSCNRNRAFYVIVITSFQIHWMKNFFEVIAYTTIQNSRVRLMVTSWWQWSSPARLHGDESEVRHSLVGPGSKHEHFNEAEFYLVAFFRKIIFFSEKIKKEINFFLEKMKMLPYASLGVDHLHEK